MDSEPKYYESELKINVKIDIDHKRETIEKSEKLFIIDEFLKDGEIINILKLLENREGEKISRNRSRLLLKDEQFSKNILNKLDIPKTIKDSYGKQWKLKEINPCWRLVNCYDGNYFPPHLDQVYMRENKISKYTIMIYFEEHQGGNLIFPTINQDVETKHNRCVIFDQDLLHESKKIYKGMKIFLRSEILYETDENINLEDYQYLGI